MENAWAVCMRGKRSLKPIETSVSPEASLGTLISQHAHNPHPIPVIDADNKLLGTVDRIGIMMALAELES